MPFSHHSHSKTFIAHGSGPLDEVIENVLKKKFHTFCFTEHMPRLSSKYLYPEEIADKQDTDFLKSQFESYLETVLAVKASKNDMGTTFIIGTECECVDTKHIQHAKKMFDSIYKGKLQFLLGSVHHVNSLDIDYDVETYDKAIMASGNSFLQFLKNYFDLQFEMLTTLNPKIIGHFDLPSLFLNQSELVINKDTGKIIDDYMESKKNYAIHIKDYSIDDYVYDLYKTDLLPLVTRNFKYIIEHNLALEINTSGLRKGLKYPYPSIGLAKHFKQLGGKFVLSDDSHGLNQLATNYKNCKDEYINGELKLDSIYYLAEREDSGSNDCLPEVEFKSMPIEEFNNQEFWDL
ncbi:related to Histidinol-phosphatase [Hanseniaspora guilliermondii]|uniref:Histidinol-phosphatase n=1 Tax=Hanseniaspora guilliermondii TaxID=56406 RepID=A0A1L0CH47_9ASCO|nr:related to Histidinol-phosphatase [Hanseniaspora guilliermondii]